MSAREPLAVGYARVSTVEQAKTGFSLGNQEQLIRRDWEYTLAEKHPRIEILTEEGTSASKPLLRRPVGSLLTKLLEPGDVVVFAKLDRGFRDTADLLNTVAVWEKMKIGVKFLDIGLDTRTDVGKLVLRMMGALAQFERDRLSTRVREINVALRSMGFAPTGGTPPFGMMIVKKRIGGKTRRLLVPNVEQREVARKIIQWKEQGFSWEGIARHLIQQRYQPAWFKGDWSKSTVYRYYHKERALQASEAQKKAQAPADPPGSETPTRQ